MKKSGIKWVLRITLISFFAGIIFAVASTMALDGAGYAVSFIILAVFILIGLTFDAVGIAVTAAAANEAPFNSMATRRLKGAAEALRLLRNADRVASYCADVIGDVTGIVSGTISALIAARFMEGFNNDTILFPVLITAVVTAITVGGKALGKVLAFTKNVQIVHGVGKILCFLRIMPFNKQDKKVGS